MIISIRFISPLIFYFITFPSMNKQENQTQIKPSSLNSDSLTHKKKTESKAFTTLKSTLETRLKKLNLPTHEPLNKLKPYEFWKRIGSPKYVCAPMVDHSELAFRLLTRKYNCELAYTPMINSTVFINGVKYRDRWLKDLLPEIDSPTFVQFCGHDPEILLRSAQMVEGKCEAVDLNFGCPQGIAKRGNYGAYLLDDTEQVLKICGYLANNLTKSAVSCKIRLFPDLDRTYDLVREIQKTGVKVLGVHGRTKEEKGQSTKSCNFEAIRKIKSLVDIPVIANGGIEKFDDLEKCFEYTKCDAVMSAEKLLEYPALFKSGEILDIDSIVKEFLDISLDLDNDINLVRNHMFKFYYSACQGNFDYNIMIRNAVTYDDFFKINDLITQERASMPNEDKLGWYVRNRSEFMKEKKAKETVGTVNSSVEDLCNLDGEAVLENLFN